jgi:hypothetical protein
MWCVDLIKKCQTRKSKIIKQKLLVKLELENSEWKGCKTEKEKEKKRNYKTFLPGHDCWDNGKRISCPSINISRSAKDFPYLKQAVKDDN